MTEEDSNVDPSLLMEDYMNLNHTVFRNDENQNSPREKRVEQVVITSPPLVLTMEKGC